VVRFQWLAAVALLSAACGTAGQPSTPATRGAASTATVTSPSATPSASLPPGKDYVPPTPFPASAGPYVVDLTWVSDSMGWALAAVPCAGQLCPAVAETTDGGATWQALPSPSVAFYGLYGPIPSQLADCQQVACVSHIRFATSKIGYLFGPSLFMTVDGGESWQQLSSPSVESLEAAGGEVFRVVYDHDGCPGPCNRTVEEAPAGSDSWRTLLQIPEGAGLGTELDTAGLVLQGAETIYLPIYGNVAGGGDAAATLFRSLDGGQTWQELADPCGGTTLPGNVAISFAAASGGQLTALCFPRGGPPGWAVITSDDSGSSWGPRRTVPGSALDLELIAAPGPGTLVVGSPMTTGSGLVTSTLLVSTDGGEEWSTAATDQIDLGSAPLGVSLWLGFEDAATGRWVGDDQTIWTTTDGGMTWTAQAFVVG